MFTFRRALLAACLLALLIAGGCARPLPAPALGDPVPGATSPDAAATLVPRLDHIVVVVLENKDEDRVIGNDRAPYLNALAAQGATMTQSHGISHPSQPNYVALFSGSTQGVTDDTCPKSFPGKANLGGQLSAAGLSFAGYSDSMPATGYTGCGAGSKGSEYQRKHNPWVDFPDLPASLNQPFSAFPSDFTALPDVSFVVPNMCNDMHNCPVSTGDTWMKDNLDAYAQWAKTHNSLLVVTFDEDEGSEVNKIPTVIVGGPVRPGPSAEPMTHYTLLRTIEAAHGLPGLGQAATEEPLRSIWQGSPPVAPAAAPPATSDPPMGLVNGSFEDGLIGWTTTGSTGDSHVSRPGGSLNARAGGVPGDSTIQQTFVAPAGKTTLSISWLGRCDDTKSKAWATIEIAHNTSGTTSTPLARTCVSKGSWQKVTQKVTPGHSYTISLVSHADASAPNSTYFDDVSLS